jgi:FkbM family methyltransferase
MFIPKDQIEWKKVKYIKLPLETTDEDAQWLYELWLNEPLASWDVFSYWEVQRVLSMRKHLSEGDVLMDIGTEQGWCNLAYASMVGPENMILVEPTPEFWPNIRALWEKNFPGILPLRCFPGFFSDVSTAKGVLKSGVWPTESKGDLIDRNSYKYIHEHADQVEQIRIDDFVEISGVLPTALTIDVEGAELLVLQGARLFLKYNEVKVWISEHDDLAERDYGVKPGEVEIFMAELGYVREELATDHERHVYYHKP